MAEATNPTPRQYNGVDVDHPSIVSTIKNGKKLGWDKEKTARVVGMPVEVVDKYYNAKD